MADSRTQTHASSAVRDSGVPLAAASLSRAIGITYDRPTRRVWVACCTGTIRIYDDR